MAKPPARNRLPPRHPWRRSRLPPRHPAPKPPAATPPWRRSRRRHAPVARSRRRPRRNRPHRSRRPPRRQWHPWRSPPSPREAAEPPKPPAATPPVAPKPPAVNPPVAPNPPAATPRCAETPRCDAPGTAEGAERDTQKPARSDREAARGDPLHEAAGSARAGRRRITTATCGRRTERNHRRRTGGVKHRARHESSLFCSLRHPAQSLVLVSHEDQCRAAPMLTKSSVHWCDPASDR